MEKLLKSITSVLFIATFGLVGYYLYSNQQSSTLGLEGGLDNSNYVKAEAFLRTSGDLMQVRIEENLSMFSEPNFRTLNYERIPLQPDEIGRLNPLDKVLTTTETNVTQ